MRKSWCLLVFSSPWWSYMVVIDITGTLMSHLNYIWGNIKIHFIMKLKWIIPFLYAVHSKWECCETWMWRAMVCGMYTFLLENFWTISKIQEGGLLMQEDGNSVPCIRRMHLGILGKLFKKSWNKRINILWQMAIVLIVIGYSGHYSLHLNHIRRINWVALLNCQWGSPSSLHFKWD